MVLFFLSVFYSILASGHPWGHYLIQIAPIMAVSAAYAVARLSNRLVPIMLIFLIIIGGTYAGWSRYQRLITGLQSQTDIYHGISYDLSRYLQTVQKVGETLFVGSRDILVYWLMGSYPVTPIAGFPSLLVRAHEILQPIYGPAVSTESLLEEIFGKKPTRVILSKNELNQNSPFANYVIRKIAAEYQLENIIEDRFIFRRKT